MPNSVRYWPRASNEHGTDGLHGIILRCKRKLARALALPRLAERTVETSLDEDAIPFDNFENFPPGMVRPFAGRHLCPSRL